MLELFIWSPVHSPHLLRLDPHLGLVSSGSEASPSTGDRYKTTRLEACSHVRRADGETKVGRLGDHPWSRDCPPSVGRQPGSCDSVPLGVCGGFETDSTAAPCLRLLWPGPRDGFLPTENAAAGGRLGPGLLPHQVPSQSDPQSKLQQTKEKFVTKPVFCGCQRWSREGSVLAPTGSSGG